MKTKLKITAPVLRLLEAKLVDRVTGDYGGHVGDTYWKILDAAAGDPYHGQPVEIEATEEDRRELYEEMDWALDGFRDITKGETLAARALRRKCNA